MEPQDVADVILLNTLLALPGDTPTRIVRLINWKRGINYDDDVNYAEPTPPKPKPKSSKPPMTKPEKDFEPSPDPSADEDPGF